MSTDKQVDYRFKILYALAIIMVVCGHVTNSGGIQLANDWFPAGGIHLPLFMFCSGYFYNADSEKNIPRYLWKKVQRLVIPFYAWNVVYGLISQLLRYYGFTFYGDFTLRNLLIEPILSGHQFTLNLGSWFLVPLFMVELGNVLFRRITHSIRRDVSEWWFAAICLILGIVGNQLACNDVRYGWWLVLVRFLYFVPFYEFGIVYKSRLEKPLERIPGIWYFGVLYALKLLIAYRYGYMPEFAPSWCAFDKGPFLPVIIGFTGILFWVRIASILEPVLGRNRFVNRIADNTFSIMMHQFIGFMLVKTIFALMNQYLGLCSGFDWALYKTDIFWYYLPKDLPHTAILYTIAGIFVPILIHACLVRSRDLILKFKR